VTQARQADLTKATGTRCRWSQNEGVIGAVIIIARVVIARRVIITHEGRVIIVTDEG